MGNSKTEQVDFLGVGAHKCGTTWLFENLKRKPNFSLPPEKEIHYFDRNEKYPSPNTLSETYLRNRISREYIKTGIRRIKEEYKKGEYKNAIFYFRWYFSNYNDSWYLSLFKSFQGIKGEITPSYSILTKEDIKRMHEVCPNAKLIYMVRNPIDRAWSHYRHGKKEIKKSVTDDEIIAFMETEGQILRSDYLRTLKNFSEVFPKGQIIIGFYDSIIEDPDGLLDNITGFLQGSPDNLANDTQAKKRKFNNSIKADCPAKVTEYLKEKYHDQMKTLSDQYGGYFSRWYQESYEKNTIDTDISLYPTMHLE